MPTFANHARGGLARIVGQPAAADGLPPSQDAALDIEAGGNGLSRTIAHRRTLTAPRDIAGLAADQILRRDPPDGTQGFEPTTFPAVELADSDLPWRYTPAAPAPNGALAPWIVLVCVPETDGVTVMAGASGNRALSLAGDAGRLLPSPHHAWLWAHVHADDHGSPAFSRLVCPIRLVPDTGYVAAVVPLFEAGRRAGLSLDPEEGATLTAWTADTGSLVLPAFDLWRFRTGIDDFETLAKRLHGAPVDPRTGTKLLDLSRPGSGLDPESLDLTSPGREVAKSGFGGALTANDTRPHEWDQSHREEFRAALAKRLADRGAAPQPSRRYDPLVDDAPISPPKYGLWQAGDVPVDPEDKGWASELNLDPGLRLAAGLGARSFRRQEERYTAMALQQIGEARKATQSARAFRLAVAVNGAVYGRVSKLPVETKLQMTRPAHAKMRRTPNNPTLGDQLAARRDFPQALVESAFLRTAANLSARLPAPQPAPSAATAPSAGAGASAFKAIRNQINAVELAAANITPSVATDYLVETRTTLSRRPGTNHSLGPASAAVLDAQSLDLRRVAKKPPPPVSAKSPPSGAAFTRSGLNTTINMALRPLPALKVAFRTTVPGVPLRSFRPVPVPRHLSVSVRLDVAAVTEIARKAPAALMPGVEDLTLNGVSLVRSNPSFVGAFLVGMNHEASREFAWRQMAADLSQTWFRRFWDYLDGREDIRPIAKWSDGAALVSQLANADADSVLVIRAELFDRHPDTIVYAIEARRTRRNRVYTVTQAARRKARPPLYDGSMGGDIRFFGFDIAPETFVGTDGGAGWFIVFEQPPFAPRFGLDAATSFTPAAAPDRSDNLGWGYFAENQNALGALVHAPADPTWRDTAIDGKIWGRSAAEMAALTYQRPVRVIIHASELVKL